MSAEVKKAIELEIAHVLFIDIVGYSKLSINEQGAVIEELSEVVRVSKQMALRRKVQDSTFSRAIPSRARVE